MTTTSTTTTMTTPLLIQPLLRSGRSPEDIALEYGLDKPKYHEAFPNLVQFKYNQLEMNKNDPMVQQCRGIILDRDDDWACVARPFDKFFNAEEPQAAGFDWKTARTLEKLDGSMCILYNYTSSKKFISEWMVATLGRPDASGNINGLNMTFKDLFWQTFGDMDMEIPGGRYFEQNMTFMFELTSPYNRVVVDNGSEPRLTLIGARNRVTGEEFWPEDVAVSFRGWKPVREFNFLGPNLTKIQESFETMDPLKQEGYVVINHEFKRVKVKHPGYVLVHQLRGSWSPRAALDAVRQGELPELAAHFPEMKAQLEDIQHRVERLVIELETHYQALKGIENQKEFALQALKTPLRGAPLFSLRAGKVTSMAQFVAQMNVDRLAETIGLATLNPKTPAQAEDVQ